jgi:hypothetical protein
VRPRLVLEPLGQFARMAYCHSDDGAKRKSGSPGDIRAYADLVSASISPAHLSVSQRPHGYRHAPASELARLSSGELHSAQGTLQGLGP